MTDFLLEEELARWRFTVHRRTFDVGAYAPAASTGIAELTDARSRRLEIGWNTPAVLSWTLNGDSQSARYCQEMSTDVMAWRWDPEDGKDHLMFRGVISSSEDVITEQSHVVNFRAMDYLAVINRRYLTGAADLTYSQADQDNIVADLVARAVNVTTAAGPGGVGGGVNLSPGSRLPLQVKRVNPDGSARATNSGILRDRTYTGGSSIGELITNLSAVISGSPVDIQAAADTDGRDWLRVWYGDRGVGRTDLALVYGSTVSGLTRSANSADYSNFVRVLGDNGGQTGQPQLIAEAWNTDANNVGAVPVGLWMSTDNASDVSVPATLQQKANGDLARSGLLVPSYSLTLRPGWYRPGFPNVGDTVPLVVQSGRLDISTTVRVLGLNYAIQDDTSAEDVEMTVGRPALTLSAYFTKTRQDVDALARR